MRACERVIARVNRDSTFVDEVQQDCRERLIVGDPPGILGFSAKGSLGAWLRVAARRRALNLMKAEARWRARAADPRAQDVHCCERSSHLLVHCALNRALASLGAHEREVLRLFHLEGRDIDGIAERHRVHRATISRWLALARGRIAELVKSELCSVLGLSPCEAHEEIAAALSQLDLVQL